VFTNGGQVREIQVIFNQNALQRYELSSEAVLARLSSENLDYPAGRIADGKKEYSVRLLSKFRSTAEIADVVVANREHAVIRLRDVARVVDGSAEQRVYARLNGHPCVVMSFLKQPNANTVEVVRRITDRAESFRADGVIPAAISFARSSDQAYYITKSVENVGSSAVVGGILAILIVWFFLHDVKRTIIIAVTIPVSILSAFILMGLFGITLNVFSLGGLVLAVGMLVDNSIVMLENIARHHAMTRNSLKAAHDASAEITSALIASTLTNLAAIVPFFFIKGLSALLFRDMIITIVVAFVISLFAALTIVPSLSGQLFLNDKATPKETRSGFIFSLIQAVYRELLSRVMAHRRAVIAAVVLIFASSLLIYTRLGSEFIPSIDDGRLSVRIRMPIGTDTDRTRAVADRVEALVREMPGVESVYVMAGGVLRSTSVSAISNEARIEVQLKEKSRRPVPTAGVIVRLRERIKKEKIADARIQVIKSSLRGLRTGSNTDIDVRVHGPDLMTLYTSAERIRTRLETLPGVANLELSMDISRPEVHVRVNRARLSDFGLTMQEVAQTLTTAIDGVSRTRYTDGAKDTDYDIRVLANPDELRRVGDVGSVLLYPPGGQPLRLREVASIIEAKGPVEVARENQVRIIQITADADGVNVGKLTERVRAAVREVKLPDGYTISWGGDAESSRDSRIQMITVALLAIFLVYVVMAVQFESFIDPLVIMTTLPLALIGVILSLYVTNTPVGATVMLGIIMLVGVVVNNAIVLLEYAKEIRAREGGTLERSIFEAATLRLKPILMTSTTTIAGLMPLALGWGEGLEMLKPLAVTVAGGMLVSTMLTLYVVPCLYVMMKRER
jgi:CzcA family heavy metal efflux pump